MEDWVTALIFVAGFVVLYFTGYHHGVSKSERRHRLPELPKPMCEGCGHHMSYHKDKKGKCAAYDEYSNCGCQVYMGPVPLAPDYLPPES